jgi:hypothetical protein
LERSGEALAGGYAAIDERAVDIEKDERMWNFFR